MKGKEFYSELKNKISMALEDPILQSGFELICKHDDIQSQIIERLTSRDSPELYEELTNDKK